MIGCNPEVFVLLDLSGIYLMQHFNHVEPKKSGKPFENTGTEIKMSFASCVGNNDYSVDMDVIVLTFLFENSSASDVGEFNSDSFQDIDSSFSCRCVSEIEVIDAMCRVKSRSVFVDGIPNKFIRIIFNYISSVLMDLFTCILITSTFATTWKNARVVPIPKSRVVHGTNDLRPISILPALSKVVEHIMRHQILRSCPNTICIRT